MPRRITERTPAEERAQHRQRSAKKTAAKALQRRAAALGEKLDPEDTERRKKVEKAGIPLDEWDKFLKVFAADYERRQREKMSPI